MKHLIARLQQLKVIRQILASLIIIWVSLSAFYMLTGVLLNGEYLLYEPVTWVLALEWMGSALLIGFGVWFFFDVVRKG